MKPVTSALHNWMSALFVHPLFRGASFFHVPDGVGSTHYNSYSIGMTSVPDHINNRLKNLLTIQCYNTKSNHIEVRVEIEQPDAIFQTGEENINYYTNLKLKDIIEFVKMYKTNFESKWGSNRNPFAIYYAQPQGSSSQEKEYIKRYQAAIDDYQNIVRTCFDFLDKREKMNIRLKAKERDF
jgi:hypothetical protein